MDVNETTKEAEQSSEETGHSIPNVRYVIVRDRNRENISFDSFIKADLSKLHDRFNKLFKQYNRLSRRHNLDASIKYWSGSYPIPTPYKPRPIYLGSFLGTKPYNYDLDWLNLKPKLEHFPPEIDFSYIAPVEIALKIISYLHDSPEQSAEQHPYSEELFLQTRAKILAANQLLTSLNKIFESLVEDNIPDQLPPKPTNFVKDNKMPAPDDDHIERKQLPLSMAEDLASTLNLMDKEMATILTISIRTYHRLKQKGLLNPVASERLVMLKDLADYGLEVFEDQGNFNEWLRSPLHELSNKSPLSLLDTATGIARVKTILGQIDYGVFS